MTEPTFLKTESGDWELTSSAVMTLQSVESHDRDTVLKISAGASVITAAIGTHYELNGQLSVESKLRALAGHRIERVIATLTGTLEVRIGGNQLVVRAAEDHEAWEIRSKDATLGLSAPGGELLIW